MNKSHVALLAIGIGMLTLSIGIITYTFIPQILKAYYKANVSGGYSSSAYNFNIYPILVIGIAEIILGFIVSFLGKNHK